MTLAPGAVASGTAGAVRLGVVRVAGLVLALPLGSLREAVPLPPALHGLPTTADGLLGAMQLRDAVLPVVDLRVVLARAGTPGSSPGGADAPDGHPAVVVVAHEGRTVGIVVDDVRGVLTLAGDAVQQVAAAGTQLLVSAVVRVDDDVLSIVDPDVLVSLPGVPAAAERHERARHDAGPAGAGLGSAPLTTFWCGSRRLALAVDDLSTTTPLAEVARSVLSGGHCLGTTVHQGRELPVLDPLSLLGLEPLAPDEVGVGVVVPVGLGEVVLAVSRLDQLEHRPEPPVPVPAWAVPRGALVAGVHGDHQDGCLVLDGPGLRADLDVQAYAALNVAVDAHDDAPGAGAEPGGRDATTAGSAGPTCLVYAVGGTLVATDLAQVSEILPRPEQLLETGAPGVAGVLMHRQRAFPVVDLAAPLGRVGSAATCLLLLDLGDDRLAFAVEALEDIRTQTWTDPDRRDRGAAGDHGLERAELVRLAGLDRLVPRVDLHRVARDLLGRGRAVVHAPT